MPCYEMPYSQYVLVITVGTIGTCMSTISHLPLLYKSCVSNNALDQLSKKTLLFGTIAHALWLLYGWLIFDMILIISGLLTTIIEGTILCLKMNRSILHKDKIITKTTQTDLSFVNNKTLHL